MQPWARCIDGVDVDTDAIADFQHLTGTRGAVMGFFDRDQHRTFHGTK